MSAAPILILILSIQGEQAHRFGGRCEQLFDCRDGSIGRSEDCDWVLRAEGVSRLHAMVRYLNGIYFIEDRSTNGMVLNGTPLRKGDPAALKHGDRLQIDTFEVSVRLDGEAGTQADMPAGDSSATHAAASAPAPTPVSVLARGQNGDPLDLSLLLAPRRAEASRETGDAEGLIPDADVPLPGAGLDPLALFDTPSSYRDEPPRSVPPAPSWNHTPAVVDRFRPPQLEAAPVDGPVLPEDWDATNSLVAAASGHAPSEPPDASAKRAGDLASAAADEPSAVAPSIEAAPVTQSTSSSPPIVSEPPEVAFSPVAAAIAWSATPTTSADPTAPQRGPAAAVAAAPVLSSPPAPAAEAGAPDLTGMFHIAVDAMMDVLRARAELKNSFRLPATLIQRSENNPLKFAPTAQEAVRKLLAPPDSGFLAGSAALNDAADDIRNHQMAMLAGVRSAFQSLLAHFDPARIEQETECNGRRLPFGSRPRHWEHYKEQFEALTRNPDECFRRLFGDEFARAYEEQLGRLKNRRN